MRLVWQNYLRIFLLAVASTFILPISCTLSLDVKRHTRKEKLIRLDIASTKKMHDTTDPNKTSLKLSTASETTWISFDIDDQIPANKKTIECTGLTPWMSWEQDKLSLGIEPADAPENVEVDINREQPRMPTYTFCHKKWIFCPGKRNQAPNTLSDISRPTRL